MGIRALLRVGMIVLAASVGLLVYLQWEPEEPEVDPARSHPAFDTAEGDPNADSVTQSLDSSQYANERRTRRIRAVRLIDLADGWNVWEGPEIEIFGRDDSSSSDDVRLVGDTMRTTGDAGSFGEVRIVGNVSATLPGGGTFQTRRLDYDAITGVASNCNPNTLGYAGLQVRARCLELRTAGELGSGSGLAADELRMWGDLSIAADESAVGLPERLQGTAEQMRFEPGGSLVTLDGDPALSFAGGRVRAAQLLLDVGTGARQLREIRAIGSASLALGDPTAGAVPREARARTLAGDELTVRFAEGAAIDAVSAHGTPAGPARLTLPNQGELQALRIELGPTGQEQTVTATGDVRWVAARGATGPRELAAGRLDLVVGAEGLQSIEASGGVRARLADADGGSRRLAGPRLSMRLVDGVLAEASLPDGVEMSLDGRSVTAASATLKDGAWVMTGTPRPRVSDPEVELEADQLRVRPDGELEATGEVTGTLGGSRLAAGAALFGSATSVQLQAGRATVGARGQTVLREAVQITWQSQSLIAAELRLEADPGRLRGSGGVELVALAGGAGAAGDFVTVSGRDLLVEQETSAIHVAGEAALNQGNRRISAERMEVTVDEGGAWSLVLAQGMVQFRQPGTEATGDRLEYDLSSGELLLLGTTERPATFVYDELEYRSAEALRVRWEGEDVIIEATESGRTITKVVRTSGSQS